MKELSIMYDRKIFSNQSQWDFFYKVVQIIVFFLLKYLFHRNNFYTIFLFIGHNYVC